MRYRPSIQVSCIAAFLFTAAAARAQIIGVTPSHQSVSVGVHSQNPTFSAEFDVINVPPNTPLQVGISYGSNSTGWLAATVSGLKITAHEGDPKVLQQLNQGSYAAFLNIRVGSIGKPITAVVYLYITPQDNQFRFRDTDPVACKALSLGTPCDISDLFLTASPPQNSIQIFYNDLTGTFATQYTFNAQVQFPPGSPGNWLSVQPSTGTTPAANKTANNIISLAVNTAGLTSAGQVYEGALVITDSKNANNTGTLPVHFVAQGIAVGQPLQPNTNATFQYGTARTFNGESGFIINVPAGVARLHIQTTATQTLQLYARYGQDVATTQSGSPSVFDAQSAAGLSPEIIIGPDTVPVLQAGAWYIALRTFSANQLTEGFINATFESAPCTYTVTPASVPAGSAAGNGSFSLTTAAGCSWTAGVNVPWIHLGAGSSQGVGAATISYSYDANTGTILRVGGIAIGGQEFDIRQAASGPGPITASTANPGVYRSGLWFVDWNGNDQWDATDAAHIFGFGLLGDLPVTGDWNGDGRRKAGVYRNGLWFVDWNGNNQWDDTDAAHVFGFGLPGDLPVTGDWNGDGRLKAGVYRNGLWFVDWNGNNQWDDTDAAHVFSFGLPGDLPVTGDWNGDGRLKAGVYRNGLWFVDWNGNNQWDDTDAAHVFSFGLPGDRPVTGNWDPAQQSTRNAIVLTNGPGLELNGNQPINDGLPGTLRLLEKVRALAESLEQMRQQQLEIAGNPDLQRKWTNMKNSFEQTENQPEIQVALRQMQIKMEQIRQQFSDATGPKTGVAGR